MLSKIAKLTVVFAPLKESSRSAKEILARAKGPKAVASNPDCVVEAVVKTAGPSSIEVEFTNQAKEKFETGELTAAQILARIQETSQILEAQEMLKKAGMSSTKLEIGPGADAHNSGYSRRVTIT